MKGTSCSLCREKDKVRVCTHKNAHAPYPPAKGGLLSPAAKLPVSDYVVVARDKREKFYLSLAAVRRADWGNAFFSSARGKLSEQQLKEIGWWSRAKAMATTILRNKKLGDVASCAMMSPTNKSERKKRGL